VANDELQHIDTDKARAGSSEHVVRYVLMGSLVLVVLAMIAVLLTW